MALKPCPECKKEISDKAVACPHCGFEGEKTPEPTPKSCVVSCLVVLLLAGAFVVWLAAVAGKPPSQEELARRARLDARVACEGYIKPRLVSPSTARFGMDGGTDAGVGVLANGQHRVMGYVDAQNAFGGMLRKRYACDVAVWEDSTRVTKLTMQ